MKVLISAVGDTDPIRNFHDGALVHIARKYRPDKIIIVFSEEMISKKDDIEKVIRSIDSEYVPEIVYHEPIILNKDVYVFDTMYDQFDAIIQKYYTKVLYKRRRIYPQSFKCNSSNKISSVCD